MRILNRLHLPATAVASLALWVALSTTQAASFAFTQPAGPIFSTNATLNAMVVPNGLPSVAWFEYGRRGDYERTTSPVDVGSTSRVVRVSSPIAGLAEGAVYQFRSVLSNSAGIVHGFPHLFTTGGHKVAEWHWQPGLSPRLSNVVAVEAGLHHGLALTSDGTVTAWGPNGNAETNVPPGLSNVVQVSTWGCYSLALKADGTVAGWGIPNTSNDYGLTNLPASLTNVISVAAGWLHALALRADGTVVAWGNNDFRQRIVPAGLSNVVAITLGDYQSLALKADGTLQAWGYSFAGLANVAWLSNVVAIAGGAHHYVALKADGTVAAWGQNGYGETTVPVGLSNVIAIASGSYHSFALKADGSLVAWGEANYAFGKAWVPEGMSNVVAVAGGDFHSIALAPNVPPQSPACTVTNAVNRDLAISTAIFDPNRDPLTYRVASLPAVGALYQYDGGGGRGPAITAPGAAITDPSGRIIFAPGMDEAGFPYATFEIVANDGEADSLPATVTVNVIPPPAVEVSGASVDAAGSFSLSFAGFTNATYRVWASTNLTHWSVLGTASQSEPGLFGLSDTAATNWPQRFYRITSP